MKIAIPTILAGFLPLGVLAAHHGHAGDLHARFHHSKRDDDTVWVTEYEVETVTVVEYVYEDGSQESTSLETILPAQTQTFLSVAASSTPSPANTETSTSAITEESSTSETSEALPSPTSETTLPAPAPDTPSSAPTQDSTTSVTERPASTSAAASPTQSSSSSTLDFTGDMTWWEPALGACGYTNSASQAVVALSHDLFDQYTPGSNPNANTLCGKYVTITGVDGNKYQGEVVDRCVGCAEGDLDLSETLFNTVTSDGDGRVAGVSWMIEI